MLFEHYQVSRACTRLAFPRCHEHVGAEKGLWIPAAARKTGEASGEDRIECRGKYPGADALMKSDQLS